MRIVGVIDLQRGRAVHARGGDRDRYEPVRRSHGLPVDGDPVLLTRVYRGAGVQQLYIADLDAIAGGALQADAIARVAAEGVPLLLDAGVSSCSAAEAAGRIADIVIVGLETLASWDALWRISERIGRSRTAFSLDLRGGVPLGQLTAGGEWPVPAIAARAVDAGAGSVIVIDVAQVGTSTGPDVERLRSIRQAVPGVTLLAGGGVRDSDDLRRLVDCGCDGALVATALHEGRLHLRA